MKHARLVMACLLLSSFAWACSALIGLEEPPYGPATDGGVPGLDGGLDGNFDSNVPDGCPPGWFCESFEQVTNVTDLLHRGWKADAPTDALQMDTAQRFDGLASLHAIIPAGAGARGDLYWDFKTAISTIRVEFRMRVSDVAREINLVTLDVPTPNNADTSIIFHSKHRSQFLVTEQGHHDGGITLSHDTREALRFGEWESFELEVKFAEQRISLRRGAQQVHPDPVIDEPFKLALPTSTPLALRIGVPYSKEGPAVEAWFDAVKFYAR